MFKIFEQETAIIICAKEGDNLVCLLMLNHNLILHEMRHNDGNGNNNDDNDKKYSKFEAAKRGENTCPSCFFI